MQAATADESLLFEALDARYELLDPLVRVSGTGEILALQRETGLRVALRLLPLPDGGGPDAAARVVRAVTNATRLHHPNIVRVCAVVSTSERAVAIATEYEPGRTLREVLARETPLPPADVEHVLRGMAAALEFAHRAGIVHGAVDPTRVLLNEDTGVVRLAGFGEPVPGAGPGAPAGASDRAPYCAPEQRYGGVADVRTDLYALGVVGWEMLAGSLPSMAENLGELLYRQALGGTSVVTQLIPNTPQRLLLALEGALQWDRPLRWSSAAAFLHQLSQEVPTQEAKRRHARIVGVAQPRGPERGAGAAAPVDGAEVLQRVREGPAANGSAAPRVLGSARFADNSTATDPNDVSAWAGRRAWRVSAFTRRKWAVVAAIALAVAVLGKSGAVALAGRNGQEFVWLKRAPTTTSAPAAVSVADVPRPASEVRTRPPAPATGPGTAPSQSVAAVSLATNGPTTRSAPQRSPSRAAPPAVSDPVGGAVPDAASADDHYARAAAYLKQRSVDDVYIAIDEFLAATRLDSSSAKLYSGLAEAYAVVLQHGWYESGQGAALAASRGLVAADLALKLDDRSEQAWLARGTLLEFSDPRSLADVFRSYRHALSLAPADAEGLRLYGRATEYTGDYDAAEATFRLARSHAPRSGAVLSDMAELAYLRRRFDDAKELLAAAIAADPRNPDTYLLQVRMRLRDAQFRDAWGDAEMATRLGYPLPGAAASLLVYAQMPDTAATRARADSLVRETRQREAVLPVLDARYLALTLVAIGKPDAAMDVLDEAYPRGAALWLALQDPGFDRLHGIRRFERLVSQSRAVGL